MNKLQITKLALIGSTLITLAPVYANPSSPTDFENPYEPVWLLGGFTIATLAAPVLIDSIIPHIKNYFYKEAELLKQLKKEVANDHFSGNEFIKEDCIEENVKNVDHSFLNIFSQEIQDILLPALIEYEGALDNFKAKIISQSDKYEAQKKLLEAIKQVKEKVNRPKKWFPFAIVSAGAALILGIIFNGNFNARGQSIAGLSMATLLLVGGLYEQD